MVTLDGSRVDSVLYVCMRDECAHRNCVLTDGVLTVGYATSFCHHTGWAM